MRKSEKKSFMVYKDWEKLFAMLESDTERGKLIMALFDYENGRSVPVPEGALGMAYVFMTAQLERDRDSWERICRRNSENGKKGGAPKGNKNAVKSKQPKQPKQADTDTDTDTDTETDTVTDTVKVKESASADSGGLTPEKKSMFGPYRNIPLTEGEYQTLCRNFTKELTDPEIGHLSEFCKETGLKFSDCYTLLKLRLTDRKT